MPSSRREAPVCLTRTQTKGRRCRRKSSEGQARGGGSRPELAIDTSSRAGAQSSKAARTESAGSGGPLSGSRAGDCAWQTDAQQSVLEWPVGLAGILPSIEQSGMSADGISIDSIAAALGATGASASPMAHRIEIRIRITRTPAYPAAHDGQSQSVVRSPTSCQITNFGGPSG